MRIFDDPGAGVIGFGTKIFRELAGRFVTPGRSDLSPFLFE